MEAAVIQGQQPKLSRGMRHQGLHIREQQWVATMDSKIKPPRMRYSNPFAIETVPPRRKDLDFIRSLGYVVETNECKCANGWIKLKEDVWPHEDDFGKCFVYCAQGKGFLCVESEERLLTPGDHFVFDDTISHSFDVEEAPCYLLIATLR